jgi:hypothetical protein
VAYSADHWESQSAVRLATRAERAKSGGREDGFRRADYTSADGGGAAWPPAFLVAKMG